MSHLFGGIQIFLLSGMDIADHKAVQRPALSSGPGGTLAVSLASQGSHHLSRFRVKFHDVVHRAVRPDKIFHHCVRVHHGDVAEAGIAAFFSGPVQQREVEHAVDDGPASGILVFQIIPGADKAAGRIETACQQIRRMHGPLSGGFVSRQPVIRDGGGHVHEAHVMMQTVEI